MWRFDLGKISGKVTANAGRLIVAENGKKQVYVFNGFKTVKICGRAIYETDYPVSVLKVESERIGVKSMAVIGAVALAAICYAMSKKR